MKGKIQISAILVLLLFLSFPAWAEDKSKEEGKNKKEETSPNFPSRTFASEPSQVWDAILTVLKKNDIPLQSSDKEKGKISTGTKRYFRILSANFPPVQKDYRDTYVIRVNKKGGKSTQIEIERKFEKFDEKSKAWVEGDPNKEMAGLDEKAIFKQIQIQLAGTSG